MLAYFQDVYNQDSIVEMRLVIMITDPDFQAGTVLKLEPIS